MWNKIGSWIRPQGMCIVLLGSDGVGKSTLLENLVVSADESFACVVTQHLRPNAVLSSMKSNKSGTASKPHGQPAYSPLVSVAKLIYLVIDYNVGYLLNVRPQLARGFLFIFDRYFYDIVIDPLRFRYGGPMWLARLAMHLVPRPDICFILTAPPDIVLTRKQDLTYEELEKQYSTYTELARQLHFAHHVDATQSLEAVASEVSGRIHDGRRKALAG